MRAVVDRADLARTRGVNERTTSRYAWVIGMMLAALAGVVGAPIVGSLDSGGFIAITFVAAAAAVLGGLRSIPLAFVGGLLLGVAENLVAGYVKFAEGHQRLQQLGAVHPPARRARDHGSRAESSRWLDGGGDATTRLPGRPAVVAARAAVDDRGRRS